MSEFLIVIGVLVVYEGGSKARVVGGVVLVVVGALMLLRERGLL